MKDTNETTKTVRLEYHTLPDPKELINFSKEYILHLPELKDFLQKNEDKFIPITFAKIFPNGDVKRKVIKGRITNVKSEEFTFVSFEDFSGIIHEDGLTQILHFDNLIGDVPMMESFNQDPFNFNEQKFEEFAQKLSCMKELMTEYIGQEHSVSLKFFSTSKIETVECEILKVNKTNVKIKHISTKSEPAGGLIDLSPSEKYLRFVTLSSYLFEVRIFIGKKSKTYLFDEES